MQKISVDPSAGPLSSFWKIGILNDIVDSGTAIFLFETGTMLFETTNFLSET